MSAIRFRTAPKGDLPHYLYIFRKPEPLGTEMKNVACSMLGTMLHLEIQKGKEDMKTSEFQNLSVPGILTRYPQTGARPFAKHELTKKIGSSFMS